MTGRGPAAVRHDAGAASQRLARAALTYLAEPGDPALGALLDLCPPSEILAAIKADELPQVMPVGGATPVAGAISAGDAAAVGGGSPARLAALRRALRRWRVRLARLPSNADLAAARPDGIRLVCPGDPEWPAGLDQLGPARPYALWVRGHADLRFACLRSVSVVGSRAATSYGAHVAAEIAADLADRGWAVVSGGAYGIDAAAHRGALAADGVTIAVLACGVDYPYPAGHADLFAAISEEQGLIVSEWPPGSRPARTRFLVRNRSIAALACGTVIVEAGERSGALNTAHHAAELGRPLMAVPGPVTSAQSAGCHRIIREWAATCVTGAADVIEVCSPLTVPGAPAPAYGARAGGPPAGGPVYASSPRSGPPGSRPPVTGPLSRDDLDSDSARVLDALPARGPAGPATIAIDAGVDLDTVLRCLGLLAGQGFIERCAGGWRLHRPGARS